MKHGGARPNAGRKRKDPTVTISFRVRTYHAEEIKQLVKDYLKRKQDEQQN